MIKKVVFVTGDKGGVGKTFFARGLADFYSKQGVPFRPFDTDKTNATFKRFLNDEVALLDIDDPESLDGFLNYLDQTDDERALVDLGAGGLDRIYKWMEEIDFAGVQASMKFEVTFAFVLGADKDSMQILADLNQRPPCESHFLIVKNLGRAKGFAFYETSKTRKSIMEEKGGLEIEYPKLLDRTVFLVDKSNLGFAAASESPDLGLADRQRVIAFRRKAGEEIERARGLV